MAHEPIRNLADLKGKKVGTFGRIAPKAIQAAGAIPVSTTGGEMYEALQRKTIDARILSFEAAQRFKTYEVAKYMSHDPDWGHRRRQHVHDQQEEVGLPCPRNTRRSSWKKGRGSASGKHRR